MAEQSPISQEYPLRALFETLRAEAGISLGIAEYLDLIRALQSGFGTDDLESLRRLCCLLWANSKEQLWKVNHHFDRYVAQVSVEETDMSEDRPTREEQRQPGEVTPATTSLADKQTPSPNVAADAAAASTDVPASMPRVAAAQQQQRKRYLLRLRYAHLSDRQLAQAWRKLRAHARTGVKDELDLEATVRDTAQRGHFLAPVLQHRLENSVDVHFLIDRDGSMVPFHSFTRNLLRGAKTVGKLPQAQVRYFHDVPGMQLFRGELGTDPEELGQWLSILLRRKTLVVILSDAGAARGNYDSRRIQATQEFLARLAPHCKRMAWLNPMPLRRWSGSSAAAIAARVPMFEATAEGLHHALDFLRGAHSMLLGEPSTQPPHHP